MKSRIVATVALWLAVAAAASTADLMPADGYPVVRMQAEPQIDGRILEWNQVNTLMMSEPNVDDLKVEAARLAWDEKNLYVAVTVVDRALVNDRTAEKIVGADCLELRFSPDPKEGKEGIYRLLISPTSGEGKPALTFKKAGGEPILNPGEGDKSGIRWSVTTTDSNWTVEAALPLNLLGVTPQDGARLPFLLVVWDRDKTDVDEWKTGAGWHRRSESHNQKAMPDKWPAMVLEK